jgi:AraC family transcriptional regulator
MRSQVTLREGEYFGTVVKSFDNPLFTCNLTSYGARTAIKHHYHENSYVSLLINGAYEEKNRTENKLLQTGQAIFRPRMYTHANDFQSAGGTCFNIAFKEGGMEGLDHPLTAPEKMHLYPSGALSSLYRLFHYFMHDPREDLYTESILGLVKEIGGHRGGKTSLAWIGKAKHILENEHEQHHTLHSIAGRVFVHPVYLARAFKAQTGYTLGEYQLMYKLRKTVSLLLHTGAPLNEIAFRTGFYDPAHFTHSFKMMYGLSPKKFRFLAKS